MSKYDITNSELKVMSAIWDSESLTMNELTDILKKNKSTIKTYVYRLERKNIIKVDKDVNPYRYTYNLQKEDYIQEKAKYYIQNLFDGDKEKLIDVIEDINLK